MSPRTLFFISFFGSLVALSLPFSNSAMKMASAPTKIKPFVLHDPRQDKAVSFADMKEKKAIVVVFLGTECPVNNAFLPVLADLHRVYGPKGVAFLGINSNRQDTPDRVAVHARKAEVPFPVLKDSNNVVADNFGAARTPEAFILSPDGTVQYQGRIDDQFGVGYTRPGKPARRDLAAALDEVLAGKAVSVPKTEVAGCFINRVAVPKTEGAVTYAKHVSRIVQNHCQECHRPGQIGPMPFLSYDDVTAWADTIREVVNDQRMPPWHADARFGKFSNDRSLSKEDRQALLAWLDSGTPKGNDKDLPPPRDYVEGWQIGKPDVVFTMPKTFEVPAETPAKGIPYQYFTIPTEFKEDKWVQAAETKPGAPDVVHHIVVFIVGPNEIFRQERAGAVLCGLAPGEPPMQLGKGLAKKVPAGSRLVMQMHYTPNGQARSDRSSVGLIFAKEPPKHRIVTRPIINIRFVTRQERIPAGAENYKTEAEYTFTQNAHLVTFMPHMHLRGKDFRYEAIYPGGKTETLLWVPRYQFDWQTLYRSAEPLPMPKGTKVHCVAHFDNSTKNRSNPDPTKEVVWGDQTWEEMMIGWIDYYVDDEKP